MKAASIGTKDWERQAEDRSTWRTAVREGVKLAEERRMEEYAEKRARSKGRTMDSSEHVCRGFDRDCHSRIGLLSHTQKCGW